MARPRRSPDRSDGEYLTTGKILAALKKRYDTTYLERKLAGEDITKHEFLEMVLAAGLDHLKPVKPRV